MAVSREQFAAAAAALASGSNPDLAALLAQEAEARLMKAHQQQLLQSGTPSVGKYCNQLVDNATLIVQ